MRLDRIASVLIFSVLAEEKKPMLQLLVADMFENIDDLGGMPNTYKELLKSKRDTSVEKLLRQVDSQNLRLNLFKSSTVSMEKDLVDGVVAERRKFITTTFKTQVCPVQHIFFPTNGTPNLSDMISPTAPMSNWFDFHSGDFVLKSATYNPAANANVYQYMQTSMTAMKQYGEMVRLIVNLFTHTSDPARFSKAINMKNVLREHAAKDRLITYGKWVAMTEFQDSVLFAFRSIESLPTSPVSYYQDDTKYESLVFKDSTFPYELSAFAAHHSFLDLYGSNTHYNIADYLVGIYTKKDRILYEAAAVLESIIAGHNDWTQFQLNLNNRTKRFAPNKLTLRNCDIMELYHILANLSLQVDELATFALDAAWPGVSRYKASLTLAREQLKSTVSSLATYIEQNKRQLKQYSQSLRRSSMYLVGSGAPMRPSRDTIHRHTLLWKSLTSYGAATTALASRRPDKITHTTTLNMHYTPVAKMRIKRDANGRWIINPVRSTHENLYNPDATSDSIQLFADDHKIGHNATSSIVNLYRTHEQPILESLQRDVLNLYFAVTSSNLQYMLQNDGLQVDMHFKLSSICYYDQLSSRTRMIEHMMISIPTLTPKTDVKSAPSSHTWIPVARTFDSWDKPIAYDNIDQLLVTKAYLDLYLLTNADSKGYYIPGLVKTWDLDVNMCSANGLMSLVSNSMSTRRGSDPIFEWTYPEEYKREPWILDAYETCINLFPLGTKLSVKAYKRVKPRSAKPAPITQLLERMGKAYTKDELEQLDIMDYGSQEELITEHKVDDDEKVEDDMFLELHSKELIDALDKRKRDHQNRVIDATLLEQQRNMITAAIDRIVKRQKPAMPIEYTDRDLESFALADAIEYNLPSSNVSEREPAIDEGKWTELPIGKETKFSTICSDQLPLRDSVYGFSASRDFLSIPYTRSTLGI